MPTDDPTLSSASKPTVKDASGTDTVTVTLGDRSYDIAIDTGVFHCLGDQLKTTLGDVSHVFLVMDQAVGSRWGRPLGKQFELTGIKVDATELASGEGTKSLDELSRLWQWMLDHGGDRRSVVVAVGGGVVGDLAGFAAATFTRGVRFVQVPTTLLAMVDSSVGGKTGVNLPGAKNMVGAFWQPEAVLIDTEVLDTLPDRSYLSGLAEVVKYGVIEDDEFFRWLESNTTALVDRSPAAIRHAIARSCQSKARVVSEDERETSGRRAILNYGHTFAHAIEATAGYGTFLHGEAVAIGMQMAARLAVTLGICQVDVLSRQCDVLRRCGLPVVLPEPDVDAMLAAMMRDKKVAHGKLRLILPSRIGSVDFHADASREAIAGAILATR